MTKDAIEPTGMRADEPSLASEVVAAVVFLGLSFGAAALGGVATGPNVAGWYAGLARPPFSPPNWLFGPVWTVLYALMAVTAFLVWRKGTARRDVRLALLLFVVQVALNALWSWVFFGWHMLGAAVVEIAILWLAIIAWLVASWRVSRLAGALAVPYLLWVSFASLLTFSIWRLNA